MAITCSCFCVSVKVVARKQPLRQQIVRPVDLSHLLTMDFVRCNGWRDSVSPRIVSWFGCHCWKLFPSVILWPPKGQLPAVLRALGHFGCTAELWTGGAAEAALFLLNASEGSFVCWFWTAVMWYVPELLLFPLAAPEPRRQCSMAFPYLVEELI